jgi:hypothetical protein
MVAEEAPAGNAFFTIGMGPRLPMAPNSPITRTEEVIWSDIVTSDNAWNVVGLRADPGVTAQVGLWECESYASDCFLGADQNRPGVTFVAIDGFALDGGAFYPRLDRTSGSGAVTGSFDAAETTLTYDGEEAIVSTIGTWVEDEVAQAINLNVRLAAAERLFLEVTPLVPGMDLGVALLQNPGGNAVQASHQAIAEANANEAGGTELIEMSNPAPGRYGIVVTNLNGVAGDYRVRVMEGAPSSVNEAPARLEFRMTSANPSSGEASFVLSLPARNPVDFSIFDVHGRLVRTVAEASLEAGTHSLAWNGRDDEGRDVPAGLYLARLTTSEARQVVKVIRAE